MYTYMQATENYFKAIICWRDQYTKPVLFPVGNTSCFFGNSCERRTAHLLAYFLYIVRISTMLMM